MGDTIEQWLFIPGTLYLISNRGRVCSPKGHVLTPVLDGCGYETIIISKGSRTDRKRYRVNRLVAEAFIFNPLNEPVVNHKDKVRINNDSLNLEWCSQQYNAEYSLAKTWEFRNPDGVVVEIFNLHKFCKEHNLTTSAMSRVGKGINNHHKGWTKP